MYIGTQCLVGHNVQWDTMCSGTQCIVGYNESGTQCTVGHNTHGGTQCITWDKM